MPLRNSHVDDIISNKGGESKALIPFILKQNMHSQDSAKVIVAAINKLLSNANTRREAFELLSEIIPCCSSTMLSENFLTWLTACSVKHETDNLKEMKFYTIAKLIRSLQSNEEFTKKFVSDHISKVLDNCLTPYLNSFETEAALELLNEIMKGFPSWFTPHKIKIEKFLISFLDSSLPRNLTQKAAVAFHWLQQVGGAGTDGINHIQNFSRQIHKLCCTLHKLYDSFFEHEVTEIDYTEKIEGPTFEFNIPPVESSKMMFITSQYVQNCLAFLMTMIKTKFPVAKQFEPKEVIDVIIRGMSLHICATEQECLLETYYFSSLLILIQKQLLQLLRFFIVLMKDVALSFNYSITKVLIDSLNRCHSCDCFKADSTYQEIVYKSLHGWLQVAKSSINKHFQNQLVESILKDITPETNWLTLNIQDLSNKNKSSKARRRAVNERIINSGLRSQEKITTLDKRTEEKICMLALRTLKQLLMSSILHIDTTILQKMYYVVINLLLENSRNTVLHPYKNELCCLELYEVVVVFYEQENMNLLPPVQLVLNILQKGMNNRNKYIIYTCERGISMLEKLAQPVCPSLDIPVDRSVTNKQHNVSDDIDVLTLITNDQLECTDLGLTYSNTNGLNEPARMNENSNDLEVDEISDINEIITSGLPDKNSQNVSNITILDVQVIEAENKNSQNSQNCNKEVVEDYQYSSEPLVSEETVIINECETHIVNFEKTCNGSNVTGLEIPCSQFENFEKIEVRQDVEKSTSKRESSIITENEPPAKKTKEDFDVTNTSINIKEKGIGPAEIKVNESAGDLCLEDLEDSFVDEVEDY